MAGDWRDDERYAQRGRNRERWSGDDWRRDCDWQGRDRPDDYAFGRDERRERGGSGSSGGYGQYYRESYGPWGDRGYSGDRYPRYGRGYGRGYEDDTWGSGWRGEGQMSPSQWGPDWGDEHGRSGQRQYGGAYGVGYGGGLGGGWPGEEYGDYGYGYGRGGGNRSRSRGQERDFWDRASDEVSSWFGDDQAAQRRRRDEQEDNRGRGPKGYIRSDDRIREDVSDALSDDSMVDASEVSVTVSNCEVTLNGTVDNRAAKRRAEDCADRISGVKHVQNNLRVKERASASSATSSTSRTGGMSSGATATGAKQTG